MCRCTSSTATADISTPRACSSAISSRASCRCCPASCRRSRDWVDHLSTAFPEVRLKSFLEMRGADGGPWSRICALPAFWVGLLYDQGALDAAWDDGQALDDRGARAHPRRRCRGSALEHQGARAGAASASWRKPILDIAHAGLAARKRLNGSGRRRDRLPRPAATRSSRAARSPAQRLLDRYHGEWGGDISRIYDESF